MATRQAEKKGCQEAILVNQEGFITEGAASGFYAVMDNKVYTTPLEANILPSITRQFIEKCCDDLTITFIDKQITPEQAKSADELFMGVTTRDVIGIVEFDGNIIGNGKVGAMTEKLIEQFKKYI
jgi:branched-subunit amino acid aminotransferase/4-amino-4-deoxychorismate lyase